MQMIFFAFGLFLGALFSWLIIMITGTLPIFQKVKNIIKLMYGQGKLQQKLLHMKEKKLFRIFRKNMKQYEQKVFKKLDEETSREIKERQSRPSLP